MKKYSWFLFLAIVLVAVAAYVVFSKPGKKAVPESKPSVTVQEEKKEPEKNYENLIRVAKPQTGAEISSPMEINGEARGTWFFEASFPVRLVDENGKELASGIAEAEGEWMTEKFVPFKATLIFDRKDAKSGKLILLKANPSDLEEMDDSFAVPVIFSQEETTIVKVFFSNEESRTEMDCSVTYPRERVIAKTQAVARAAIELLLAGPTLEEKSLGYFTSINPSVKLNSISMQAGKARVDFDSQLEQAVGGSCRVTAIRAQIEDTLRQFPTVKEVIISVNGRTKDILQP